MRIGEIVLLELFNRQVDLAWVSMAAGRIPKNLKVLANSDDIVARFDADHMQYAVIFRMLDGDKRFAVVFGNILGDRLNLEPTGTGNQLLVYSGVFQAVHEFCRRNSPKVLLMWGHTAKQHQVYQWFVKRVPPPTGFHIDTSTDAVGIVRDDILEPLSGETVDSPKDADKPKPRPSIAG